MSWLAKRKLKFARWYYGTFVNDPRAEVIMFGMVRSHGAQRFDNVLRFFRNPAKRLRRRR